MQRNWVSKVLWFTLGIVVASVFAFAMPARGQDYYWQEIVGLKQRVAALEQYNKNREKADQEAAERARREEASRNRADRYK